MISCDALYTKDDYIQAFSDFVSESEQNANNYTEKEWENADKKFDHYINTDYQRFKKNLNPLDELALAELRNEYVHVRLNAKYKKTK
jgi:transposase